MILLRSLSFIPFPSLDDPLFYLEDLVLPLYCSLHFLLCCRLDSSRVLHRLITIGLGLDFDFLFLHLCLRDQAFRKGPEVSCEENRVGPTSLFAPQPAEVIGYGGVGGCGQAAMLSFAKLVVALGNLPYCTMIRSF